MNLRTPLLVCATTLESAAIDQHAFDQRLVLDAGIAAGLTTVAEDLLFQIGMTWNFGT